MQKLIKIIKNIFLIILVILITKIIIYMLTPTIKIVAGGSGMAPAIEKGDILTVDKRIKKFNRGDIVLYWLPFEKGKFYQRVVAIPNDKIEIKRNKDNITEVYLNDKLLDEPYKIIKKEESTHPKAIKMEPVIVGEYRYFVLGDDRDLCYDSRFFGPLNKWFFIGKVVNIERNKEN